MSIKKVLLLDVIDLKRLSQTADDVYKVRFGNIRAAIDHLVMTFGGNCIDKSFCFKYSAFNRLTISAG
jgi:hypothetical protein